MEPEILLRWKQFMDLRTKAYEGYEMFVREATFGEFMEWWSKQVQYSPQESAPKQQI